MKILILEENEKKKLEEKLKEIASPYEHFDRALLQIYPIFASLPETMLQDIFAFARYPDTYGALLIKNLPVDKKLPDTPKDGLRIKGKQTYVSEGCALGLAQLVGEPVGYLSEKSGEIIHNVVPVKEGAYTQSNQGSKVFLNFHNDIVYDVCGFFHEKNPDFLILFCLRPDKSNQAFTYFCDARDICKALSEEDRRVLRKPLFRACAPSTYTREVQKGEKVWSKPMPIISGPEEYPEVSISASGILAMTPAAKKSFERLQAICRDERVCKKVHLKTGDALLINNRKGLHAREAFEPEFDGNDRWLQRIYVRRTLWDLRERWTGTYHIY